MSLKQAAITLFILGMTGSGYGYWGAFTRSGSHYYDEMDAYYPFFLLVGSSTLLLISFILAIVVMVKRNSE